MKIDDRVVYVGFGRRVLAGLIDLALVVIIVVTLSLLGLQRLRVLVDHQAGGIRAGQLRANWSR